jgi:phosphatidylserine decarboxylase precursor
MKRIAKNICMLLVATLLLLGCVAKNVSADIPEEYNGVAVTHEQITLDLIGILANNPELERLLVKAIEMAYEINPDRNTNPAQTLEEYFEFLNRSARAMPWNVLPDADYSNIYEQIYQGTTYFYFILDQPLPELEGKGFFHNSLQYVPELHPWIVKYVQTWGAFLSSEESWNSEYYELMKQEARFNLDKGWYEDPSNWRTFNDFFARRLNSPAARPIAYPDDDSVVVSPADAQPQGVWLIDENSYLISDVQVKSSVFSSINHLLGEDNTYRDVFAGGTFTHTYLDIDDYHGFHFPVSGIVREARVIPGQAAVGGLVTWDTDTGKYIFVSPPGWQMIETRACVIIETREFGYVAVLPVGMSQIASVVLEDTVVAGAMVQKGDMLGYFQFGGSNIVMLFEKRAGFELMVPEEGGIYNHILMGQVYGRFSF